MSQSMGMLWSAGNLFVHVYLYDLTLTHFQQKGPQTMIQGLFIHILFQQLILKWYTFDSPKHSLATAPFLGKLQTVTDDFTFQGTSSYFCTC
jgi:hypothetical protein